MPSYLTAAEFYTSAYGSQFYTPSGDCNVFGSEAEIQGFLDNISSLIDLYTGRTFATGNFEETVRVQLKDVHYLSQIKIRSITSITYREPSNFYSGYDLDEKTMEPTDYYFYPDGKIIFRSKLPIGSQVTFRYVAGPDSVPGPIKTAVLMWANAWSQSISVGAVAIPDGGAVTSVQYDKVRETYVDPRARYDDISISIPVTVKGILDKYRLLK